MHYLAVQRYSLSMETVLNKMIFSDTYDHHYEDAEPYACADMHFDPKPPTEEVLNRYNITEEEYYNICNELECKLCVGSCGWCV